MVVMAQLDVDNASNSVRAISRGSTVFQDFNAFDGRFRNGAKIEERYDASGPNRIGARRRPSTRTSVYWGPRPRSEIAVAPGVKPVPLLATGTPPPLATGRFLINSSAVRSD